MSSGGPHSQLYFCYQCNRTVTLTPLPDSDLCCPNCHDGFLEEYSPPPPQPPQNPNPNFSPFLRDPFSLFSDPFYSDPFFSSAEAGAGAGAGGARAPMFSSTTFDFPNPNPNPNPNAAVFNPFDFLQSYLQGMRARGGEFQIVIDHPGSGLGSGAGGVNLGDYFLGPGLEELIQHLAENDPNRYGTPPASKKAVEGLPEVVIDGEVVGSDSNSCAVCMSEFVEGTKAKQMPCKHFFHSECLLPWLELHNSCPVCRFELPTDDPDYENRRGGQVQGGGGGGEGSGSGSGSGGGGGQTVERRFRISLPWPLNAFMSSGGNVSNQSEGGNGDGNGSGSGSGNQVNNNGGGNGGNDSANQQSGGSRGGDGGRDGSGGIGSNMMDLD